MMPSCMLPSTQHARGGLCDLLTCSTEPVLCTCLHMRHACLHALCMHGCMQRCSWCQGIADDNWGLVAHPGPGLNTGNRRATCAVRTADLRKHMSIRCGRDRHATIHVCALAECMCMRKHLLFKHQRMGGAASKALSVSRLCGAQSFIQALQ